MADPTPPNPAPAASPAMGTAHFDAAAATWDDNPTRRALTAAIAEAIQQEVPLQRDWRVLEYGCGTAALGLLLVPYVQEVVAADASPGMIEQVRRKLAAAPVCGLTPRVMDLTAQDPPAEEFDLIVMAMALHHVADPATLLGRLGSMVAPGGTLAVADLCAEDGSFHSPMQVPHNGFAPDALAARVRAGTSLGSAAWRIVHQMTKNERSYPVFLLTFRRR